MSTCDWMDATLIRYLLGLIVGLYGTILFSWWWVKSGRASFVFMCVTFLFFGDTTEKVVQVYGRWLRLTTHSTVWSEDNWLWIVKGDISMIASLIVVVYLSLRVFGYMGSPKIYSRECDASGLCRGATGVIVHKMDGPAIFYRCMRCGKEWEESGK